MAICDLEIKSSTKKFRFTILNEAEMCDPMWFPVPMKLCQCQ